jgi:hypothetical protein
MATILVSSEMSSPFTQEMKWRMPSVWDVRMSLVEANGAAQAGMVIVNSLPGKSFVPTDVMFKVVGANAGGATLLRVADEDNGVVLSHVVADCTDGAWVSRTGGTPVATRLGFPTAIAKGLKFQPTVADITGAITLVRVIVKGFYIDA